MKKLFFNPLFFKVTLLFVLFFGGISFEGKAQTEIQQDSIKRIFNKTILDIAKITTKSLIDVSNIDKETAKKNIDKYEEISEFKDNRKAIIDIPSIQPIINKANTSSIKINGKDITSDTTTIREFINNIFSEIGKSSYKNKYLNKDSLNKVFTLMLQKSTLASVNLLTPKVNTDTEKQQEKLNETIIFTSDQSKGLNDIVDRKIDDNNTLTSKNLFPILNGYQEYALLASLGLGLIILLLVLFTNSSLSSLKNKVKKISSTSKAEVDSSKFVFSHVFDKEKGQLETQIQEMQKTIHQLSNEIERLKVKNDTVNIKKSSVEKTSYFTNPINTNLPTRETKYAKYPSSENGFSSSSLKSQNDDEAIYTISINGNQATFEINQNNFEAMQRAMNDTTSFLSKACDFLDVPQNNKRPQTDTKGTLQLIDNVWQITQKAKIKFV